MTYFNNLGQGRVGWRSPSGAVTPSTLSTSIYAVWNADTLGTSLDTSIYGVYNGDNVNDSSGNARNGTNVNNVTFTTGKVGNAFTFNGSNYISLPNSSFDFLGDFSISAWVKIPSAPTSIAYIFQNDNYDVATSYGYGLNVRTNRTVSFYVGSINGTSTVTSTTVLALNTWYHVAVKRDSVAKRSDLYINGVFEAQATNTNITIGYGTRAIQPTIGAYRGNNQGVLSTSNFLNGSVDALTIWDKVLSDNEITSLYNSGNGAEYPFSTQTLDSLNDAVGTNHGTRPSSTLTGGVPGPSFTTGKIGKAFTFDGINDYVSLPVNSLNFPSTNFSVSTWIYIPSGNTFRQDIITNYYWTGGPQYGWWLIHNNSGQIQFSYIDSTQTQCNTFASYSGKYNGWHLIVATKKLNGVMKLYIDGTLIDTNNTTTNPIFNTIHYPAIGTLQYSSSGFHAYFGNGSKIDAVNVWNRELSAADVTELYNSGNGKQYPY